MNDQLVPFSPCGDHKGVLVDEATLLLECFACFHRTYAERMFGESEDSAAVADSMNVRNEAWRRRKN